MKLHPTAKPNVAQTSLSARWSVERISATAPAPHTRAARTTSSVLREGTAGSSRAGREHATLGQSRRIASAMWRCPTVSKPTIVTTGAGAKTADVLDVLLEAASRPTPSALSRVVLRPRGGVLDGEPWSCECRGLWPPLQSLDAANLAWVDRAEAAVAQTAGAA